LITLCQCQALHATTDALDPAQFAYNLNTSVAAYEKAGRKDPQWDADARKCLALFARIRSWTNETPTEVLQELRTTLARVVGVGCDDPLIRYLHLRFVDPRTGIQAALAFSETASALQKSAYPDIRKFYATFWARRASLTAIPQPPEAAAMLTTAASYLAKALDDPSMPPPEADQACDLLMSASQWFETPRWDCYQILEKVLTNRWKGSSLALLVKGQAYLAYAWKARGRGLAPSVADEGWKLMAERSEVAAAALEEAWALNPRDGRICLAMMRVERGQGKGRDRLDLWFQRGMKLDPGSYDLCYEKIEYLRPRWYGSFEDLISFGRACTTNTSWKGDARLMLANAHVAVSQEIQDGEQRVAYLAQPKVWADVQFTFEQFFKLYPEAVGYRHNYALNAYWCGQWKEFLNQVRMFPSTNYAYFGGVEQFNMRLQKAERLAHK
jgi:hypothetical protein